MHGQQSKAGGHTGNICNLVVYAVIVTFFAIYAFSNPDLATEDGSAPAHCMIVEGANQCTALAEPYEIPTGVVGVDMSAKFLGLFLWGFIIQVCPVAGAILAILGGCTGIGLLMLIGGMGILCQHPAHMIWVIITACQAWSSNAAIAAGDNIDEIDMSLWEPAAVEAYSSLLMPASQNFLNIWAWIFVILYGCGVVSCILLCVAARDKFMEMTAAMKAQGGMH